jgi:hypothetical protein
VTNDLSPSEIAQMYDTLGRELVRQLNSENVFDVLTRTAVERIPGAEHAGITRVTATRTETVAPTSELVKLVDQIQYDLRNGPCVDAVLKEQVFETNDLATDPRWPAFGRRAAQEHGVRSMLSFRMYLGNTNELRAGLNLYSSRTAAFDENARVVGLLLATHGALAVHAAVKSEKADNLEIALHSSREIGIAMGVLMNRHKLTRDQAFDLLRVASQNTHRKLAAVARDVADTGEIPLFASSPHKPELIGDDPT